MLCTNEVRRPRLSICIPTWNRGQFLKETLESIITQVTDECEVVILDTNSRDNTEEIAAGFQQRCPQLRYLKEPFARGLDQDRDRVIQLSRGDYIWTVSSKDILKPNAVESVLRQIRESFSVILLNMEVSNLDQSSILIKKHLDIEMNRTYQPGELSRLFSEGILLATHFSCSVVKREIWASSEREQYFGSIASHVGIIFQKPLAARALIIATPMIRHRFGSQSWLNGYTNMLLTWPSVVDSLAISDQTKSEFRRFMSQDNLGEWIACRAYGQHSWSAYRIVARSDLSTFKGRLFAMLASLLPGSLVNSFELARVAFSEDRLRYMHLEMLRASTFYFKNWSLYRVLIRFL
jgi:abequosyltransferase